MKRLKLFSLFVIFMMCFTNIYSQTWNQIGQNLGNDTNPMNATAISGDGTVIAHALDYPLNSDIEIGTIKVFSFNGSNWIQKGENIDFGNIEGISYSKSGNYSLSLSNDGNTLIVGNRLNSQNGVRSGAVRIYKFSNNNWEQFGSDILGEENQHFGSSVSLSSNGIDFIVGASTDITAEGYSGMVKVYKINESGHQQVGQTLLHVAGEGVRFGLDVDINDTGNKIVACYDGGGAKVFALDGSTWIPTKFFADASATSVKFNKDGNRLAIGSIMKSNLAGHMLAGQVSVYESISNEWEQIGDSVYGDTMFSCLGSSVGLNSEGNVLAAGSAGISSLFGKVKMFKLVDSQWIPIGEIIDTIQGTFYGETVGLSDDGNRIFVGAREGAGSASPHLARVYDFDCGIISPISLTTEAICSGDDITIGVEEIENITFNWYETENSEEILITGSSYALTGLDQSGSYWVEALNTLGCVSNRTEVNYVVYPLPVVNTETELTFCGKSSFVLTADSQNSIIRWYADAEGVTELAEDETYETLELTESTNYWVEAESVSTGCLSGKILVQITRIENPLPPTAEQTQTFLPNENLSDLEVEATGELTWYSDELLTNVMEEDDALVDQTTYYVTQTINGCQSQPVAIYVTLDPLSVEIVNESSFTYYPNPVVNELNFSTEEKILEVMIYDMSGKIVFRRNSEVLESNSINLQSLASGSYWVNVKTMTTSYNVKILKR